MCYNQCFAPKCMYCSLLLFVTLHFVLPQLMRNAFTHFGDFVSIALSMRSLWYRTKLTHERVSSKEDAQKTTPATTKSQINQRELLCVCCIEILLHDQFKVEWKASMESSAKSRSRYFCEKKKTWLNSQVPALDLTLTANFICTLHKASLHCGLHYIKPKCNGFVQMQSFIKWQWMQHSISELKMTQKQEKRRSEVQKR